MRRLIVLLMLLLPATAQAATAPVQVKATLTSSAVTTVSVTLDSAPTSGNKLFAFITRGGAVGLTGVSGGGVSSWTEGCSPSSGGTRYYVYSGTTTGASSTVTATFGGNANLGLIVVEGNSNYSFEACGALQALAGTQTTMSSGALTNTSANALMVAFGTATTATVGSPTGGYTTITVGSTNMAAAYLAVSSSASQSTSWSINAATGYNALIVSLAESTGGGGGGGSAGGGLLLRGVGAALWHRLWPFGGRAPILGVQVDVGAIRADYAQP